MPTSRPTGAIWLVQSSRFLLRPMAYLRQDAATMFDSFADFELQKQLFQKGGFILRVGH